MNFSPIVQQIVPGFYMECYTGLKCVKTEYSLPQILNRTQKPCKNSKQFWRLHLGRESVVHPSSNGEGLRDIQHSTSMVLTRGFIFDSLRPFITKCHRYYCKMLQLFYYKMRPEFFTKCVRYSITICDVYYKLRQYNDIGNF